MVREWRRWRRAVCVGAGMALLAMFGLLSAVINLPIVEKPVQRLAPAAT